MTIALFALGCILNGSSEVGFTSIVAPATHMFPRNTEGSVLELKDGRLLLVWTQFYSGTSDHSAAVIAGMTSSDGGLTWSKPFLVQENTGRQNVMSASLIRLRSGKIGLFYLVKNSSSDLHVYARFSTDEAKTWGEPIKVTMDPGYNIMNNDRVIQLSDSRIIAPISYVPDISKKEDPLVSFVVYSDDEGRTWKKSKPYLHAPMRGAMEPGVVELADGRLLMIIRTQTGQIYKSISADKGETWSEPEPMGVRSPESPASIKRIPGKKDLLLVWNDNYEPGKSHVGQRCPLTIGISEDDGNTWSKVKNIETDPSKTWAYTSITFVKDCVLLTYYETSSWNKGLSLRFRSIPLKWLYSDCAPHNSNATHPGDSSLHKVN